ncbi:integrase core domain-containing protein [Streptomyces sp. NPDC008125]|uniref:integrase core domain-containing protein n=1 Tax=Streptomyces sp. NPDC008125 TaxID=3364811 RepID=UPI0036E5BA48
MSIRYGERLIEAGATASVGSVADSYDNAMAEALNGSFKAEPIEHHGPWRDADQVERAVVQWVGWYNTERLYSALTSHPTRRIRGPTPPIPGDHQHRLKPDKPAATKLRAAHLWVRRPSTPSA